MRAAIVAGGLGTRAAAMTGGRIPKALLPVGGVPIVFHQLRTLRRAGVRSVTVLAGHLGDQLRAALEPEATALGLALHVVVEAEALGTAGCLTALDRTADDTLIVSGDMLFDLDLARLHAFHRRHDAVLTVVAHPNDHPRTSDLVVEDDGLARAILPRTALRDRDHRNLVPAGLYLAAPRFLESLPPRARADMIRDTLPTLLGRGVRVAVYNTPEYLRDVGTRERHATAERDLAAGRVAAMNAARCRPAMFFDCDGVLNEEPGPDGALTPDDVRPTPGAGAAVRAARDAGFLTVAVTNRPQVAKGLVTCEGLRAIIGRLEALLAKDGGVLDRVYACPHHPETGFAGEVAALKRRCDCRKPAPGMLQRACAELPIDAERSLVIGDSLRDIGAARAAHMWAYGLRGGHGCRDGDRYPRDAGPPPVPDLMFDTVAEAVAFAAGYRTLAAPVVARVLPRLGAGARRMTVAIGGPTAAGKTVTSHAVLRALRDEGVTAATVDNPSAAVVILDGAARADVVVFVATPLAVRRARFSAIQRWKGRDDGAIETLWRQQAERDGPSIDAWRAGADLVLQPAGGAA